MHCWGQPSWHQHIQVTSAPLLDVFVLEVYCTCWPMESNCTMVLPSGRTTCVLGIGSPTSCTTWSARLGVMSRDASTRRPLGASDMPAPTCKTPVMCLTQAVDRCCRDTGALGAYIGWRVACTRLGGTGMLGTGTYFFDCMCGLKHCGVPA